MQKKKAWKATGQRPNPNPKSMSSTKQQQYWKGQFGKEYIGRNSQSFEELDRIFQGMIGHSKSSLYEEFLADLPKDAKILEVGCNIGNQLDMLARLGFTNLHGIELNPEALEIAKKRHPQMSFTQGSATDMPFEDSSFDLVFTSGVLIHLNDEHVKAARSEIHRCSARYILGYEYFAETRTETTYRGEQSLMWKENFMQSYLDEFADLEPLKEKHYPYTASPEIIDQMFLLKKQG